MVNQTLLSSRQTKNHPNKLQIRFKILTTKQSQIKTNKTTQIPKKFIFLSDSLSLPCSHLPNSSSKAASFLRLDRLSHSFSVSLNRFLRLSHCIRFSRYKYLGTSTRNKIGPWWLVLCISFGPSCFLFIYKACVFFFWVID